MPCSWQQAVYYPPAYATAGGTSVTIGTLSGLNATTVEPAVQLFPVPKIGKNNSWQVSFSYTSLASATTSAASLSGTGHTADGPLGGLSMALARRGQSWTDSQVYTAQATASLTSVTLSGNNYQAGGPPVAKRVSAIKFGQSWTGRVIYEPAAETSSVTRGTLQSFNNDAQADTSTCGAAAFPNKWVRRRYITVIKQQAGLFGTLANLTKENKLGAFDTHIDPYSWFWGKGIHYDYSCFKGLDIVRNFGYVHFHFFNSDYVPHQITDVRFDTTCVDYNFPDLFPGAYIGPRTCMQVCGTVIFRGPHVCGKIEIDFDNGQTITVCIEEATMPLLKHPHNFDKPLLETLRFDNISFRSINGSEQVQNKEQIPQLITDVTSIATDDDVFDLERIFRMYAPLWVGIPMWAWCLQATNVTATQVTVEGILPPYFGVGDQMYQPDNDYTVDVTGITSSGNTHVIDYSNPDGITLTTGRIYPSKLMMLKDFSSVLHTGTVAEFIARGEADDANTQPVTPLASWVDLNGIRVFPFMYNWTKKPSLDYDLWSDIRRALGGKTKIRQKSEQKETTKIKVTLTSREQKIEFITWLLYLRNNFRQFYFIRPESLPITGVAAGATQITLPFSPVRDPTMHSDTWKYVYIEEPDGTQHYLEVSGVDSTHIILANPAPAIPAVKCAHWVQLSRLSSSDVEIRHITDEVAEVEIGVINDAL